MGQNRYDALGVLILSVSEFVVLSACQFIVC